MDSFTLSFSQKSLDQRTTAKAQKQVDIEAGNQRLVPEAQTQH